MTLEVHPEHCNYTLIHIYTSLVLAVTANADPTVPKKPQQLRQTPMIVRLWKRCASSWKSLRFGLSCIVSWKDCILFSPCLSMKRRPSSASTNPRSKTEKWLNHVHCQPCIRPMMQRQSNLPDSLKNNHWKHNLLSACSEMMCWHYSSNLGLYNKQL